MKNKFFKLIITNNLINNLINKFLFTNKMSRHDIFEPTTRSISTTIINNDIEKVLNTVNLHSKLENKENDRKLIIIFYIIVAVIVLPIIICDFYYAINDDSCVKIYPEGINISMKEYLITCSVMSIVIIIISFIISYTLIHKNSEDQKFNIIMYGTIPIFICTIFSISWHIIGAIIFWGTLYPEHSCNKDVSTYLFVTLIIKLISCFNMLYKKNNDK